MRQQINLYQPIFREERKLLSASSVTLCLALLIGGLTGVHVYAKQRVTELEIAVQAVRDQTNRQQEQLAQLTELQTKRSQPADLELRVKQLALMIGERERALQVLQSGAAGQTSGFANRLEALARRHVAGLWLDGLKLSGTGSTMLLQGATINPDLVPLYLRSLAEDTVLAGTRFDEFIIQRPEPEKTELTAPPALVAKGRATAAPIRFSAGSTTLLSGTSTTGVAP